MATSSESKYEMQADIRCDTCENTANHLCKTCLDRLCDKCKVIHSKSKGTFDHKVVLLTCEAIHLAHERPTFQIICKWHTKFRAIVGCNECKVPLCEKCLIGDHNGHNLMDINQLFQYKKNKRERQLSMLYCEVSKSESKIKEIRDKLIEVRKNKETVKTDIENHFQKVYSTLHISKNMLLNTTDDKAETFINLLTSQERILHFNIETTKEHINNIEKVDLREKIVSLFYDDFSMEIPTKGPSFTQPGVLEYSEELNGQIQLGRVSERLKNFHIRVREMQQVIRVATLCKEPIVTLSYSSKSNAFWIFSYEAKAYKKIDLEETCTDIIEVKTPKLRDRQNIAVNDNLVVFVDSPFELSVLPDSQCKLCINVASMEAVCLCLTSHCEILVGLQHLTEKVFAIARFNLEGKPTQYIPHILKEWSQEPFAAKRHFQINVRAYITENINGDICLSVGSDDVQAVIIISQNGDHRNTYKGVDSSFHQGDRPFLPRGICTNYLGHIFVVDVNNSMIHMLDANGTVLTMLTIPSESKIVPISLCIDNHHNLCIGCADGKIRILKYLF